MHPILILVLLAASLVVAYLGCRLALRVDTGTQKPRSATRRMVRCALVAAVYAALCLVLAPFCYGAVQVRVAEMLCLLPVFGPDYIVGVTLGCFLANLLGVSMGTTVAVDVVFGTLATLLACLATYRLRKVRTKGLALVPSLPPVVFNALIVGAEISIFFTNGGFTVPILLFNMLTVGLGEIVSCCVLGVLLVRGIEANARLKAIFAEG
ncbi:MAG: QueT transporter family protein [Faecalibacterium sp.]|jgi:uncharacterized membrane protein|nr:QueT transporter family protein [Faecalibacterium sp.]